MVQEEKRGEDTRQMLLENARRREQAVHYHTGGSNRSEMLAELVEVRLTTDEAPKEVVRICERIWLMFRIQNKAYFFSPLSYGGKL